MGIEIAEKQKKQKLNNRTHTDLYSDSVEMVETICNHD